MRQKFLRGYRVKITDKLPISMSHFPKGMEAIVDGSYSNLYGGKDIGSYALTLLDSKGKPYNRVSWYYEDQLTLISRNRTAGEKILEDFNFKEGDEDFDE